MDAAVNFGDNIALSGRRSSRRVSLALPARFECLRGSVPAQLTSLSCNGAMIALEEPPRVGSDGVLTFEGLEVFCSVVWADSRRCGLKFYDRLTQQDVLEARHISDRDPERQRAQRLAAARAWAEGRKA
jgi:hypothetical protein